MGSSGPLTWVRRRVRGDDLRRLTEGSSWTATSLPAGVDAGQLAVLAAFPRGARGYGIRSAVRRPVTLDLEADLPVVEVAAFTWWFEDRTGRSRGTSTYEERSLVAAAARVPGLDATDRERVARLRRVLGRLPGQRAVEVLDDVVLLTGRPAATERGLHGVLGSYGPAADELLGLLRAGDGVSSPTSGSA